MDQRQPNAKDLVELAKALNAHCVEYALIGGTAMALHGFPRATKDIDLFLPVDKENAHRLLDALKSIPNCKDVCARLRPKSLEEGYSTALEGEICIDLLFVAADKKYADLKEHVIEKPFGSVSIKTLDVEGMIITKQTKRASDVPDCYKLYRLRNAIREKAGLQPEKFSKTKFFGQDKQWEP